MTEEKGTLVLKRLENVFPGMVKKIILAFDETGIILEKADLEKACRFLKEDEELSFDLLSDLGGVDYHERAEKRFEVVYHLYSTKTFQRLRIKVAVGENEHIPTLTGIWRSAEWPERECFEMFGIKFEDHPDLRRLLTLEEFNGFPLRKDYPVQGKSEIISGEGEIQWRKRE